MFLLSATFVPGAASLSLPAGFEIAQRIERAREQGTSSNSKEIEAFLVPSFRSRTTATQHMPNCA